MSKRPLSFTLVVLAAVALIAVAASPSKPAPASLWVVYSCGISEIAGFGGVNEEGGCRFSRSLIRRT
jgi:hypothetical protein